MQKLKAILQWAQLVKKPVRNAEVQNFLFREHEVSSVDRVRNTISEAPWRHCAIHSTFAILFGLCLAAGAIRAGDMTPYFHHFPHFTAYIVAVGFIVYPYRMWPVILMVQLMSNALIYAVSGFSDTPWYGAPSEAVPILIWMNVANIIMSMVIAVLMRLLYTFMRNYVRPFETDLILNLCLITISTLASLGGVNSMNAVMLAQPEHVQEFLGYSSEAFLMTHFRAFQGGVIVAGVMIAMLEGLERKDFLLSCLYALLFAGAGIVHNLDLTSHELLEALIAASLLTLVMPVRLSMSAMIIGIPLYVAISGNFIVMEPPTTNAEMENLIFTQGGLMLLFVVVALRMFNMNGLSLREGSIRRLNTVRDFANIGVFSISMANRIVRFDRASKRVFNLPSECSVEDLANLLPEQEERLFLNILRARHGSASMLFRILDHDPDIPDRVLRLYLWFETNKFIGSVVYGMVVEVTDEYARETALQEALNELSVRQDKQKQMFSIISHELRTPASVISMLVEDLRSASDVEEKRKQLSEASHQLLSVLADMRQAVNPEQNLPVNLGVYRANELAETVANTYRMQASAASISLRLEMGAAANDQRVGDSVRLKQILGNLVRNSIIHSQGQNIWIVFKETKGPNGPQEMWKIVDDGVGIPHDAVDRLFEPFERGVDDTKLGSDPRAKPDGSGLGLFIVKSSIELLGGQVQHFEPDHGGAGYALSVPKRSEPLEQFTKSQPKEAAMLDETLASKTVLLAEDNALVAQVTKARLAKIFKSVTLAENGKIALEAFNSAPTDIVVTDLFMPEMDGDELITALRGAGATIPIIGLTAAVVGDDAKRFDTAGADLVMAKPLNMDQLLDTLSKHFA